MAVPSWKIASNDYYGRDPDDQYSWLFKIELIYKKNQMVNLHQWKCSNKNYAIRVSKNWGPAFGAGFLEYGLFEGYFHVYNNGKGKSYLSFKNSNYKKMDLSQFNQKNNVHYPQKVIGKIMNENVVGFSLSEIEVFAAIKK
eukprot:TRINITY_DN3589_c0_g1_i3.p2 TRINITY_DN3589_c0_g1~~TRINITY_DN3589_c0_g1_i3.p2  ORF type:complete len:141 (+),score=18.41 TRINITY_DN3589_c0_g1_i3:375-797(+)